MEGWGQGGSKHNKGTIIVMTVLTKGIGERLSQKERNNHRQGSRVGEESFSEQRPKFSDCLMDTGERAFQKGQWPQGRLGLLRKKGDERLAHRGGGARR